MKFIKSAVGLVAVGLFSFALTAAAQMGWDTFAGSRSTLIAPPQKLALVTLSTTNGPVDIVGYSGRGYISFFTYTNLAAGGGTVAVAIETSPDTTNWTALANYALINSATGINITNTYWGIGTNGVPNVTCSNNVYLPFTSTSPNAASAGFNTPYPAYVAWTNAATSISANSPGWYFVGLNLTDCPRYIHLIWNATGGATNGNTVVGAFLNGSRSN